MYIVAVDKKYLMKLGELIIFEPPKQDIFYIQQHYVRILFIFQQLSFIISDKNEFSSTVKPVLETICIKRPPAVKDYCSDTTILLKST